MKQYLLIASLVVLNGTCNAAAAADQAQAAEKRVTIRINGDERLTLLMHQLGNPGYIKGLMELLPDEDFEFIDIPYDYGVIRYIMECINEFALESYDHFIPYETLVSRLFMPTGPALSFVKRFIDAWAFLQIEERHQKHFAELVSMFLFDERVIKAYLTGKPDPLWTRIFGKLESMHSVHINKYRLAKDPAEPLHKLATYLCREAPKMRKVAGEGVKEDLVQEDGIIVNQKDSLFSSFGTYYKCLEDELGRFFSLRVVEDDHIIRQLPYHEINCFSTDETRYAYIVESAEENGQDILTVIECATGRTVFNERLEDDQHLQVMGITLSPTGRYVGVRFNESAGNFLLIDTEKKTQTIFDLIEKSIFDFSLDSSGTKIAFRSAHNGEHSFYVAEKKEDGEFEVIYKEVAPQGSSFRTSIFNNNGSRVAVSRQWPEQEPALVPGAMPLYRTRIEFKIIDLTLKRPIISLLTDAASLLNQTTMVLSDETLIGLGFGWNSGTIKSFGIRLPRIAREDIEFSEQYYLWQILKDNFSSAQRSISINDHVRAHFEDLPIEKRMGYLLREGDEGRAAVFQDTFEDIIPQKGKKGPVQDEPALRLELNVCPTCHLIFEEEEQLEEHIQRDIDEVRESRLEPGCVGIIRSHRLRIPGTSGKYAKTIFKPAQALEEIPGLGVQTQVIDSDTILELRDPIPLTEAELVDRRLEGFIRTPGAVRPAPIVESDDEESSGEDSESSDEDED